MKRLLWLSLALNAVLFGWAAWRSNQPTPMPRELRSEMNRPTATRVQRPGQPAPGRSPSDTPWAAIESPDPRQLITNLRAIGCPEPTIRDLVTLRVCRKYREQWVNAAAERARSWNCTRNWDRREWQQQRHTQTRLRQDMQAELENLLGQPWTQLARVVAGWSFGGDPDYLSLDKRQALRDLQSHYQEQIDELNDRREVIGLDDSEETRLQELRTEMTEAIAARLTPQEQEEWLFRESPAANHVRQHLPEAKDEAEFRQIVRLVQQFDLADMPASLEHRYGFPEGEDNPAVKEYQQRKNAFEQRLQAVLGEERMAEQWAEEAARLERERQQEVQRNEQEARQEAEELALAAGVTPDLASRFIDRIKELEPVLNKKFEAIEKGLTGTAEEKQAQLQAAIEAEMQALAVEIMGDKGRDFIRQIKERHGPASP
jgi:hypothetical protein